MTASLDFRPPRARLRCYAGDDATVTLNFTFDDIAMDLTGTHLAQIRPAPEVPTVLGTFEIDDTDASTGVLVLVLTNAMTAMLPKNASLAWDLQWHNVEAQVKTLIHGILTITTDVSR